MFFEDPWLYVARRFLPSFSAKFAHLAFSSKFVLTGIPTTVVHCAARSFTVIAQDAFGNTITNYTGSVRFTNAGGTALRKTRTIRSLTDR